MFDTSLALADVRMNQIMKKLSGWAAIIAVPTFVTSFVGMNVGFPLYGTLAGFVIALVLIIGAAVGSVSGVQAPRLGRDRRRLGSLA